MIAIQRGAEPTILSTTGKTKCDNLCKRYDSGNTVFKAEDFDGDIYGDKSVKETLKTMQYDKCCFCESKITHIDYGDVEHFRPKAAYKQNKNDKKLSKPGYYWLAYDWSNLLLSCTLCNQRHKGNLFPLLDNSKRAKNHHSNLADETPLFINPTLQNQNPDNYISFREEVPFAINDNEYGKHTISFLALDREELNEQRLEKYNELQMLLEAISIARQYPAISELKSYANKASVKIEDMKKPQAEYSAMIKANFKHFS